METIIYKAKVLRVKRKDDYQELFFDRKVLFYHQSIKVTGCDKDIDSMLKKSFWGRSQSFVELHVMGAFVVKIYLDGVLLCEKTEENYPEALKKALEKEKKQNKHFEEKFLQWLPNYPKKENIESEIFSFNDIILRAFVGALFDKVKILGKWNDDLYQRRCSLLADLMHLVERFWKEAWSVILWPKSLDYCKESMTDKFQKKVIQSLDLQNVDEQVATYLTCWISDVSIRSRYDRMMLNDYWATNTSLFSDRKVDRLLMIEFDKDLKLCQPWDEMPNFVLKEPLSQPEFKLYLSKQNR